MPLWKRNLIICWFGSFATMAGMSMVIPFLPLYIEELGVQGVSSVAQWSSIVFSATFMISAFVSPLWGKLADRYGRKLMLLRASLGMALIVTAMGFAQNVYHLLALRLFNGAVSGFIPSAITLIASQTPREHSGWALGTLSTGAVAGSLLGPLIGGVLSDLIGLRYVFYLTGGFLFIAFLVSILFVHEEFTPSINANISDKEVWKLIPQPKVLLGLFLTSFMLQLANLSIEPIITIYIKQLLENPTRVALISGLVVSAPGLANILMASPLGKLSDKVGPRKVLLICLIGAGIIFIPQAFVQNPWQLMGLRFLFGLTAAGLLPSINTLIKRSVPSSISGRVYGYNQSALHLGNIAGPLLGGQMTAHFGFHYVFFSTSALLLLNALLVYKTDRILAASDGT